MKSNVARFTSHVQTCPCNNSGCCRLLKFIAESIGSNYIQSEVSILATCNKLFNKAQQADLLQDRFELGYYCAFHKHANSKVQKPPSQLRFSLPSIIIRMFVKSTVRRATSLFNSFSLNVAKQVGRFCYPFYHSLISLQVRNSGCLWRSSLARSARSRAPWVRKGGKLLIRENVVIT